MSTDMRNSVGRTGIRLRFDILAFLLSGVSAIAWGFLSPSDIRIATFERGAFGIMIAAFALFAHALWRARSSLESVGPAREGHGSPGQWRWLVGYVVIAAMIFLVIPPAMRIQMDESHLSALALGLRELGQPKMPIGGIWHLDNSLEIVNTRFDKRGLTFPFLVQALHAVIGFRAANVFLLNFAVSVLTLFFFYRLLRLVLPDSAAGLGSLFLASFPVFGTSASSAGFELANLAALLFAGWTLAAAHIRRQPELLWLHLASLPLLAELRYESALAVGLFLLASVAAWWRMGAPRLPLPFLGLPFLFLPYATRWALPFDYQIAELGLDKAFSLSYVQLNIVRAAQFFAVPSPFLGGSPAVFLLALAGCFLLVRTARHIGSRLREPGWQSACFVALTFAAVSIAVFAYAWSDFTFAPTARLAFPAIVLVCGLAGWTASLAARRWRLSTSTLVVFGALLIYFALGNLPRNPAVQNVRYAHALEYTRSVLARDFSNCRILVLSRAPHYFLLHGYSALTVADLTSPERVAFMIDQGVLDAVVGIELLDPTEREPPEAIPEQFPQSTFDRRRLNVASDLRLKIISMTERTPAMPACAATSTGVSEASVSGTRSSLHEGQPDV